MEPSATAFAAVTTSPFEGGARSAGEACDLLNEHGLALTLSGLRWFQNRGLIDKPGKEGRHAVYSRDTLNEVASLRILADLYGRSVQDLETLRARRISFTEVVQHLLRLESDLFSPRRNEMPKMVSPAWERALERRSFVAEFFTWVLDRRKHPAKLKVRGRPSLTVPIPMKGRRPTR